MNSVRWTSQSHSGPSYQIWGDCPILEIIEDPSKGYGFFDDFIRGQITPTITTVIDVNNYNCFGSSGATITYDDSLGGAVVLSETTDDESVSMTTEQHPFWISQGYGKLWFEGRIKLNTIATTESAIILGLMDTTALSVAVPLTADAGAIADVNFVGFHKLDTDLGACNTSYKANGVTAVEVNDAIAGVFAADTYVKLGMKFDPSDNYLRFYVNGVEQANKKLIPNATGTDFPADIGLAPVVAMHLGAAASDNTLTMDWWRCYQLRTS